MYWVRYFITSVRSLALIVLNFALPYHVSHIISRFACFPTSSLTFAEFISLSTSFATFYLGMYLFVKPSSDVTATGEVLISVSIVTINFVFFLYAGYLLYKSFKEYAIEKFYTVGQTDAEAARVKARLDAMSDEVRAMIAKVDENRRIAAEAKQARRKGSLGAASGLASIGSITDPTGADSRARRASMALFGGAGDADGGNLLSIATHTTANLTVAEKIASSLFQRGSAAHAPSTIAMRKSIVNGAAAVSSDLGHDSGIELSTLPRASSASGLSMDSCGSVATTSLTQVNYADTRSHKILPVESIIDAATPLDLVAFVQRRVGSNLATDPLRWTHVGVIVDSSMLDIVNGRAGELYVLEALRDTGGDDEPCNVETGTSASGVQIRSLREVRLEL
jgi:hypothetical protein